MSSRDDAKTERSGSISADDMQAHIEDVSVKLSRTATWSGLETAASYGPESLAESDYQRDLGDPGNYPFTRGAFPEMYRSRMWTLRNIVGYGAPEDTREGIRNALEMGSAGINIVLDTLSQEAIDPDHPVLSADAGQEGCSLPTVHDLEVLLAGIDVTKTDVAWHSTMMVYPLVVAMAQKQGKDISKLQGSHMPDHLQLRLGGRGESIVPAALGHRTTVDCIEYSAKNSPGPGLPPGLRSARARPERRRGDWCRHGHYLPDPGRPAGPGNARGSSGAEPGLGVHRRHRFV